MWEHSPSALLTRHHHHLLGLDEAGGLLRIRNRREDDAHGGCRGNVYIAVWTFDE
jgi:hypothetical protein